jgi:serine/threonine-protein kinase
LVAPASTELVVETIETLALDDLERLRELVAKCERSGPSGRSLEETVPEEPAKARSDSVSMPPLGSVIAGRYRVGQVLGSGGMGIVLAAEDTADRTPVAIKFLQPHRLDDERSIARLVREARASQKLESPHVVRVIDIGTEQGFVYLVMERLEGTDLRALLATEGRLSIGVAVRYVLDTCEALVEAHALGIVHRDLKPANLFLTHTVEGRPILKVLDFGIAKDAREEDAQQSLTGTAGILGSPSYMSPEQIRNPKSVDGRADVWALAVVLYELLTNALPFGGASSAATLASIMADPPIPLRSIRPDVPRELALVVERCLTKNASERTPSIVALARQLAPFAPRDWVPGERLGQRLEQPAVGRGFRPKRAVAAALATGTLLLVGGGLAARLRGSTGASPSVVPEASVAPPLAPPTVASAGSGAASGFTLSSPPLSSSSTPSTGSVPTAPSSPVTAVRRPTPRVHPAAPPKVPEPVERPLPPATTSAAPKLDPAADYR